MNILGINLVLQKASKDYYEGHPSLTDEEFDKLAKYANWKGVGYNPEDKSEKLPHLVKLSSLQKVFEGEEAPQLEGAVVTTPKLDGAAVSLLYYKGELVRGLTRGNGEIGVDITPKVKNMGSIPYKLRSITEDLIQIVGEIVVPKTYENARNLASGSLNLKDIKEFRKRPVHFIAYNMFPEVSHLWTLDMLWLSTKGFDTVLCSDWDEYPQDGLVFRMDNYEKFNKLGYTAHHPRGAYAYKKRQEGVVTKLLDVIWQVGKSGVVSPVALLEPIEINGATIKRATLHNIKYIEELNLEIGCLVEVIRSGEIIPRVVKRVGN